MDLDLYHVLLFFGVGLRDDGCFAAYFGFNETS